jgi:hypothetical protein
MVKIQTNYYNSEPISDRTKMFVDLQVQRPATGGASGAGFTGLRVPEQILKLFECQSILLKILRLCVKKNLVKLIPY